MAGADLLGELCRAVEKDTQQENRNVHNGQREADSSLGKGATGRDLDQNAGSRSPVDALVDMYKAGCEAESVDPWEEHVRLLGSIPQELVIDARHCGVRSLQGTPGGAVLRVTSGCPKQVGILLTTLAPPAHAEFVVLVDTIEMMGVQVSQEALAGMLDNALWWGPWWRLRCLIMRDCGIVPAHIRSLGRLHTVPALWNLEILDLSDNVHLGTDPATGCARGPGEYATSDVAFLIYLWKQSKIRRLSLSGCNLGTSATECLLKVLCSYHLPDEQVMECGVLIHGGARYSLECLELGICDDAIVETLLSLVKALPKLKCVGVSGLGEDASCRLREMILHRGQQIEMACTSDDQRGIIDGEFPTPDGELTVGQGEDRNDDEGHEFRIVSAGKNGIMAVNMEECTSVSPKNATFCTNDFDSATLLPPLTHVLPELQGCGADTQPFDGTCSYLKLPEQLLDDFGLNETIRRPENKDTILQATDGLDKYSLDIVSPRKIASSHVRRQNQDSRTRQFGDGGTDDEDELLPGGVIDLRSEKEDVAGASSTCSDDDEAFDGNGGYSCGYLDGNGPRRKPPTIDQINFKMRDGALDEDSKLGRIYRATAKKNIASISNRKKKKAAKRAFSLWDQCTENSWDRRRWTNPSKTQNDEPHILGQLNLMFDILYEEGLEIGFPFPLWQRGKGASAFLPEQAEREVIEVGRQKQRTRRSTDEVVVESDVKMTGDRPKKKRQAVLLLSEDSSDS